MRHLSQDTILPAGRYMPCGDIAIITTYFNSEGFRSKRINFDHFSKPIREGGCTFQAVECVFANQEFELPASADIWRVRARDVMWQKERLLNAIIRRLPPQITKVAWIDADVLFEDPTWLERTSRLLDEYQIVQPFECAIRLPRGHCSYSGHGFRYRSFGAVFAESPLIRMTGDYREHGHTGFAWAARRSLLERHGLFDFCIAGSGDHMIIHGMCGDVDTPCIERVLGGDSPYRRAYSSWAKEIGADVQGRIGYSPGVLLHLWHGEMAKRQYVGRNQELVAFGFDPQTDLILDGHDCCWEWNTGKPGLREWARAYFASRDEDGGAVHGGMTTGADGNV